MIQQARKLERHERILSSLDKLQYATVKQLNRLHRLSSDRNCYRVLRQLEDDKLVKYIKREMNIYHLTKEGRELIGSEQELPKHRNIDHILMRNDLYVYLGNPQSWKIEQEVEVSGEVIRADAYFTRPKKDTQRQIDRCFVEVDHTTPMIENKKKITQYEKLNKAFKTQYDQELTLIFYVVSETRKRTIIKYAKGKVPVEVYSVSDLR